jgi:hypothetical protein
MATMEKRCEFQNVTRCFVQAYHAMRDLEREQQNKEWKARKAYRKKHPEADEVTVIKNAVSADRRQRWATATELMRARLKAADAASRAFRWRA